MAVRADVVPDAVAKAHFFTDRAVVKAFNRAYPQQDQAKTGMQRKGQQKPQCVQDQMILRIARNMSTVEAV